MGSKKKKSFHATVPLRLSVNYMNGYTRMTDQSNYAISHAQQFLTQISPECLQKCYLEGYFVNPYLSFYFGIGLACIFQQKSDLMYWTTANLFAIFLYSYF